MTRKDDKALLALKLIVEGNSLRSTGRIIGVDINTVMKLLVRAGERSSTPTRCARRASKAIDGWRKDAEDHPRKGG